MEKEILLYNFIRENGRPVSEVNPGSKEMALAVEDAEIALKSLHSSKKAILGGDIMSENEGRLMYAYQLWGHGYHYLNWSCDKEDIESEDAFISRSYDVAMKAIADAARIADVLHRKCYIVLVT